MIEFTKGMYQLNDDANFNFQLNRLIHWDGGRFEDVKKVADQIDSPHTWKTKLIELGDQAYRRNDLKAAIAYYRMSEFFMYDQDEDKLKYYHLAVDLFNQEYKEYFDCGKVIKFRVPYVDMELPVMYAKHSGDMRGTIVLHGGYDSYYEELFNPMLYLSEAGFDVYVFEGPGQGDVLRNQGKKFTNQWESVVKVILDYFELEDVCLIGISLGGMLAPRAAAFEKRIKYVVCWSLFPDFIDVILANDPLFIQLIIKMSLKFNLKWLFNRSSYNLMKKEPIVDWGVKHGMFAFGVDTPFAYLKKISQFEMMSIASDVKQDVLLLQGTEDHFIDYKLYNKTILALKNAKSITLRLFTKQEEASNHCQVGNTKLVLDMIISWMDLLQNNKRK